MLFGIETYSFTQAIAERLDGVYSKYVAIMMGLRKGVDETIMEYIIRRRSAARQILANATGTFMYMAMKRH
eukprot:11407565-Karenia_brevis.AAC.1